MKVLFFTYDFPYPTNTGGKNRAFHLLRHAIRNGVEVNLFSFVRDDFKDEQKKFLYDIGVNKINTYKRKKLLSFETILKSIDLSSSIFKKLYFDQSIYRELLDEIKTLKFDLIHFESLYTAFYISDEIKMFGVKQLFGTENIEYQLYHDYVNHIAKPYLKPLYRFEAKKIEKEEKELLRNADASLAVTKKEAEDIKKITRKDCFVIENGVDLNEFRYDPKSDSKTKNILFVGNFSYFPNLDAITFLYNHVFKRLEDNGIKLIIVGRHSRKLTFINDPRVEMHEFVSDIKSAYHQSDILISPVRIGGGTNFKVLEAMACGVPVIAHPTRVRELDGVTQNHVLFARSPEEFERQINNLFNNMDLKTRLARNARKLVEENYSWKDIGDKLYNVWRKMIDEKN